MELKTRNIGLNTICGINGVGKDTVAGELRKRNPNLIVTSEARLLMYFSGISKTYDVSEEVNEEHYKQLEAIPRSVKTEIENNKFRQLFETLQENKESVLLISHLVPLLRHGDEIQYLKRELPSWFVEPNENFIQLVAPADIIRKRRVEDTSRLRPTNIDQILEHQGLCDIEWERISRLHRPDMLHTIQNINLSETVVEIENILYAVTEVKSTSDEDIYSYNRAIGESVDFGSEKEYQ